MALQKQTITLDFGFGGIDERTDPKYLQKVKFADLRNVRFDKIGRIDRRLGNAASYTSLVDGSTVSVTTFSETVSQFVRADDKLLAIVGENSSAPPKPYRMTGPGFVTNRTAINGSPVSSYMPVSQLRSNDLGGASPFQGNNCSWDRAESTNYIAIAYEKDGTGTIRVELYDRATKSLLRTVAEPVGYYPMLLAHPDKRDQFLFLKSLYAAGATAKNTVDFFTFSATTSLTAVVGMPSNTDVFSGAIDWTVAADANQSSSALVCIAWKPQTLNNVNLRRATWPATDGSGAALSTTAVYAAHGVVTLATNHNKSNTSSDFRVFEFFNSSATGIYTFTVNRNLTVVLPFAAVALTSTTPSRIIGCQLASGAAHAMIEFSGALPYLDKIEGYSINTSNTSSAIWIQRGMSIHSKAAAKTNGEVPYFFAAHIPATQASYWTQKPTQNTLFVVASTTGIQGTAYPPPAVGRIFHTSLYGKLLGFGTSPNLEYNGSEFVGITPELSRLGVGLSVTTARYVLKEARFSSDGQSGWVSAPSNGEALISGGFLSTYCQSEGVIPAGPLLFPSITVSATTSGGSMTTGSYAVSGVFEYTDAGGRIRTSAPATPVTFALSGTQVALIVTAHSYRIGDGLGGIGGNMRFVPYRTLVNESQVYYRANSTTVTPTSDTVAVSLTAADATVSTDLPLYITGGVQENWQPSAPIALATNGRRTLVVAGDRPNFVMESKPFKKSEGVSFMEEIGRTILPGGDRIHALASYLDRWFAFKELGIFVATGDGADVTGQNDSLSEFEQLTTGLGCTQPRSVITTSAGVVFMSNRGFYNIGPDMSARYIGGAVEDRFSGQTVVSATYDEKNEIVYFSMSGGETAVLSIFTTDQGQDLRFSVDTASGGAVAALGGIRYCAPTTGIYAESTTSYIDQQTSATAIPTMRYTTAWSSMGGIQGFGRIYKAQFAGQFSSTQASTTVTVQIGYDYSTTYAETHTIDSANFKRNGESVHFEIRPQRTRCEAIRFDIQESGPASVTTGTYAPGLSMNQIQLEVGIKSGSNQLPSSAMARKS